jgi:hypothetical protein
MAEFPVTEDQAFVYLRRVSSVTNIKLRDVVANIVEKANEGASGRAVHQTVIRPTGNGRVNPPSGPRSPFEDVGFPEAEICHRGHAPPGPLTLLRGADDERRRVRSYRWH